MRALDDACLFFQPAEPNAGDTIFAFVNTVSLFAIYSELAGLHGRIHPE